MRMAVAIAGIALMVAVVGIPALILLVMLFYLAK